MILHQRIALLMVIGAAAVSVTVQERDNPSPKSFKVALVEDEEQIDHHDPPPPANRNDDEEDADPNDGGYWNIQLSPTSISSVPFGPGHITVWEHADAPGRYYAMPLVDLLNHRVKSRYNVIIGKYEMTFDVLMWSVEAKQAVYHHLVEEGRNVDDIDDIEMLPMENVRITWKGESFSADAPGRLQDNWRSNTDLPPILTFQFMCGTQDECDQIAQAMKCTPDMFLGLHLEYIINGQSHARRNVQITGSSISSGKLFTKLENMPNLDEDGVRFLSSVDMKKIVSESAINILASVTRDSNYVDTGDEVSISNLIERILTRDEESAANFEPHKWDSVFWNPTWARPDKTKSYLNEALVKSQNDSEYLLTTDVARESSSKGNANFELFKVFKLGGGGGSSSNVKEKVSITDIQKILEEKETKVQWTGEAFEVKPMKLFRVNLAELKTSASFAVASVQVHKYESVQTIPVRVSSGVYVGNGTGNGTTTSSLTAELVQGRFREELAAMEANLTHMIETGDSEMHSRMSQLTSSTTSKDNQLQNGLNQVVGRMGSAEGKLSTLPGWAPGSYCILAGATAPHCPPGFHYVDSHINNIATSAIDGNIKWGQFGLSNILCHGHGSIPCGSRGAYVQLQIRTCCK